MVLVSGKVDGVFVVGVWAKRLASESEVGIGHRNDNNAYRPFARTRCVARIRAGLYAGDTGVDAICEWRMERIQDFNLAGDNEYGRVFDTSAVRPWCEFWVDQNASAALQCMDSCGRVGDSLGTIVGDGGTDAKDPGYCEVGAMKILHVITGMQKAAGTSVFCGEVCNRLVQNGHEVTLAVVDCKQDNFYPVDERVRVVAIESVMNGNEPFDLVHIHALWSPILHQVAKWARRHKIPIVWSPHGMLTPWAMNNKKWKKLLGWWLYQKWDLTRSELIHVTAQSEVADVRRMGLKNKIMVAPLGVEVDDKAKRMKREDGKQVLLFVSRVQRKKGLFNLVQAWAQLPAETRMNWVVRIVGPDQEGHTAELKKLGAELSVENDFEFVGPKYGDDLTCEYASADLFVLPTHSENFGSVVIESLAHRVPVICTKGAPWEELETHKCGRWIDIGVEPLLKALTEAMAFSPIELQAMGERGRKLVEGKYTWHKVVRNILHLYKFICKGEYA